MGVLSQVRPRSAVEVASSRFLTPDDVVDRIGDETTSPTTVYRDLRAGLFPAIRLRYRWVVPARAVLAMESAGRAGRAVEPADWDFGWDEPGPGSSGTFFRLPAAARLLTVSPRTLDRLRQDGEFPAFKYRSFWVVPTRAIDAMERDALERWSVVHPRDYLTATGQTPRWAQPMVLPVSAPAPAPVGVSA